MHRYLISNDFFVFCSLASLLILTMIKLTNKVRFLGFLKSLINSKYLRVYEKEKSIIDNFNGFLLFNFCLNSSVFVFIYYSCFYEHIKINFKIFSIVISVIILIITSKIFLSYIIGKILNMKEIFRSLIFLQINRLNYIGILLLPLNLTIIFGLNYNHQAVVFTLLISALLYITGLFKFVQLNLNLLLSNFFYFILYICSLEIGLFIIIYDQLVERNYL